MRSIRSTNRSHVLAGLSLAAFLTVMGFAGTSDAADRYGGFRLPRSTYFGGHHGHFHAGRYGGGHYGHGHFGWSGPLYHGPSLHYDSVWHHEYNHWTPGRGWHGHGHFDAVPHYVPGHFDYHHYNHIDPNPWYHH